MDKFQHYFLRKKYFTTSSTFLTILKGDAGQPKGTTESKPKYKKHELTKPYNNWVSDEYYMIKSNILACRSMSKMLPLFGSVGNPMNNSKVSMDTSRRKLFLPVNIFKWSSVISTGLHSPPCLELRVTLFLSWCSMQPRNLQHLYLLQGMFSSPIYSFLALLVNKGYLHGRWSTSSTLPNQKGNRGVTIGIFHFLPSYYLSC